MTKQETEAYYDAVGSKNRVVFIDSMLSKEEILSAISATIERNGNETVYLEIFHMNENIGSYSITRDVAENLFTLWQKQNLTLKLTNLNEIVSFIYTNMPTNEASPYDLYVAEKISNRDLIIKSFKDPSYSLKINKNNPDDDIEAPVLGRIISPDGDIEYHCVSDADITLLHNACEQIHDKNIRLFTKTALLLRQSYINDKLQKDGNEGIFIHTLRADKALGIITGTHYSRIKFQQHEIDMMRSAVLLADILKYGWDDDPDENAIIRHPSLTANAVRSISGIIDANELNFITNCIEAHSYENDLMGHVPPCMPDTEFKHTVQLSHMIADMLDRRK